MPTWLNEARKHLDATVIVVEDQKNILDQLVEEESGVDVGSVETSLAAFVAVIGTLSTIVLSWRKDVRDSRAELERIEAQKPKIELP